ncbi:MAG: CDP-glucose 4,6-dehydratase [Candidatus Aenigmarchaeota archaeon]|nr:CDP-glucose 4,6-dehydratase [Candidatus Aenigmarchaeota archaeon]
MYALFNDIYKNKKVLVTGSTGFKGSWLSLWLHTLGAKVYGFSIDIPTKLSHYKEIGLENKIENFEKDIRSLKDVQEVINKVKPDFIFHLAAQPLVRQSFKDPVETIETNVIGTMNILEALRKSNNTCCAIIITSDKCYDNIEWVWGYKETDTLGGKDPYSASKGCAELVVKTYANSFFNNPESKVKVGSARAGNVIGGGDWAQDRIVVDCIKAWAEDKAVEIRNMEATRPWQHVLEPLSGYLLLGELLHENPLLNGEAFNFGPKDIQSYSVRALVNEMRKHWKNREVKPVKNDGKEAKLLKLCCDKAANILNWQSTLTFEETAKLTTDWYKKFYSKTEDPFKLSKEQIDEYIRIAFSRNQKWVKDND